MCVCVCVCNRERDRDKEREREGEKCTEREAKKWTSCSNNQDKIQTS